MQGLSPQVQNVEPLCEQTSVCRQCPFFSMTPQRVVVSDLYPPQLPVKLLQLQRVESAEVNASPVFVHPTIAVAVFPDEAVPLRERPVDEERVSDWLEIVSIVARVDNDVQVVWAAAVAVMASIVLAEVDVVRPTQRAGTGGSG